MRGGGILIFTEAMQNGTVHRSVPQEGTNIYTRRIYTKKVQPIKSGVDFCIAKIRDFKDWFRVEVVYVDAVLGRLNLYI